MSSDLQRAPESGTVTQDFLVQGMTCGSCAGRVQRALRKQVGVQDALVNFATGKAHVVFDPAATGVVPLAAAAKEAGYALAPLVSPEQQQAQTSATEAAQAKAWLWRTVVAWPLGPTTRVGDVEMLNLIGSDADDWQALAADPGARLHLYGKRDARDGRKMGHLTKLKLRDI